MLRDQSRDLRKEGYEKNYIVCLYLAGTNLASCLRCASRAGL